MRKTASRQEVGNGFRSSLPWIFQAAGQTPAMSYKQTAEADPGERLAAGAATVEARAAHFDFA